MQTESMAHMISTDTAHNLPVDDLDRAHEKFQAEILQLDSKAAQRLFKTIAEDGKDGTPALHADLQQSASAR